MKKILSIAIALALLCACTLTVSAAETDLGDITFGGWWTNHENIFPITEEGFTVTFTSTATEAATDFWDCPSAIVFASDDGTIWGGNYVEYWIHRADNWGYCSAGGNSPYGDMTSDDSNPDNIAALEAKGITIERTFNGDVWNDFLGYLKGGVQMTISAKLEGGNVVLTYAHDRITHVVTLPVDTSRTNYLCLTGEDCALTNVKLTTPDAPPTTGDLTGLVVAAMVVSGAALVVLKKKES